MSYRRRKFHQGFADEVSANDRSFSSHVEGDLRRTNRSLKCDCRGVEQENHALRNRFAAIPEGHKNTLVLGLVQPDGRGFGKPQVFGVPLIRLRTPPGGYKAPALLLPELRLFRCQVSEVVSPAPGSSRWRTLSLPMTVMRPANLMSVCSINASSADAGSSGSMGTKRNRTIPGSAAVDVRKTSAPKSRSNVTRTRSCSMLNRRTSESAMPGDASAIDMTS